ncbi:hypothetical protein [Candidatus Arsenophonus triatominarum]|uniref:hypothetical protein n=1 Tax=Candidatus Arsenophonus triatominarum TaxID=57911 RepID=UPI0007C4595A
MQQLFGYYFAEQNMRLFNRQHQSNIAYHSPNRRGWRVLEDINRIVGKPEQHSIWQLFSSFYNYRVIFN